MSTHKLMKGTAVFSVIAVLICCMFSPTNFYHEPLARCPKEVKAKEIEYAHISVGSNVEPVFVDYRQAKCNTNAYILANATAHLLAKEEFNKNCTGRAVDEVIDSALSEAYPNITESLIDLFARAIWNETGILGTKSMYYTGSVMLNRVKHKLYANTLEGVIYQSGQYAITWTGLINRPAPEEAYEIARDLLYNGSILPDGVVFQAQFEQGDYTYDQIGNTYYCGLY